MLSTILIINPIGFMFLSNLDTNLVMHNLGLGENTKPIMQKPQKLHPTLALMVKEELQNLLDAKFIQSIDYLVDVKHGTCEEA